jgi:hypothetical protein
MYSRELHGIISKCRTNSQSSSPTVSLVGCFGMLPKQLLLEEDSEGRSFGGPKNIRNFGTKDNRSMALRVKWCMREGFIHCCV